MTTCKIIYKTTSDYSSNDIRNFKAHYSRDVRRYAKKHNITEEVAFKKLYKDKEK